MQENLDLVIECFGSVDIFLKIYRPSSSKNNQYIKKYNFLKNPELSVAEKQLIGILLQSKKWFI